MPTSYSTLLGLALPVTGELSGTWGDEVNNYITQYLDSAVAGVQTISGSQTAVTLSRTTNAALSQAGSGSTGSSQYQIINCTGNPASALTITVPSTSKVYVVLNNTSTNQTVTVKPSAAAGVTVAAARAALIAWNGTDFELVATDDASKMNGVLAAANGGTGQSSYTVGDILFASGTTTLSKLADVATGNALISGGVGVAPSYGKIGLTTHVSGTLPIANGGTNATATPTGGAVAYGTGTAYAFTSAGTSGQVLTSAGASVPTWTTATNANTASAIVQRDASGNFSAGTITATLSGTATQVSNSLTLATSGTGLSGSATFNGASAQTFTVTSNATSANTASTIVARDASGNFSAGTITASLSGNATSATTATTATSATTATNLAGGSAGTVPYQSAAGTTVQLAAGTSGQVLTSNGAAAPSWTTPATVNNGTLTMAVSGTGLSGSASFTANQSGNSTFTVTSNATNANTASTIVARDASGNFSAGTITAALSGNASTATTATQVSNSLTLATSGTGLSGSATFNGASAQTFTVTSNATSANTASTIVARDASGNFSAGTITATLSGNATNVSGIVAIANGGTGSSTLAGANIAVFNASNTFTAAQTFRAANAIRSEAASTQDAVVIAGRAGGTGSFASTITPATLSANRTVTLPDETFTVGFRNLPPSGTRTTSYTLTTSDVGKYVQVSTGGSIVIPTSTFAEGDAITLFNNTTGNITITCSAPTAYIAGTNTVKTSMTLATRGVATILFISSTLCVVTGNVT